MTYEDIYTPLENLKIKGLGPKTLEKLKILKMKTLKDLIYNFPRAYEDRTNIKKIKDLKDGEFSVVCGEVMRTELTRTRTKKSMFKVIVKDETGFFEVIWFRMPYLKAQIKNGVKIMLLGHIKHGMRLNMLNPEYRILEEDDVVDGEIEALYNLVHGIKQSTLKRIMKEAINTYGDLFENIIDEETVKKLNLQNRKEALYNIHFPKDDKKIYRAKKTLAFEELWLLECSIISKRYELNLKNNERYELEDKKKLVKKFLEGLKFELTNAQKKVITEIYKDLNNGLIVNRLIQGDVGSGKTIVAVIMLLYMVENGYQGVFMAPTEILAEQHYLSMIDVFNNLGIKVEILTSSISAGRKKDLLNEIEQGLSKIVIGTHALIEENVKFKKLGLIVIDEQHKFGVKQRQRLREKGVLANLLVMSATPIPRSLALSIYGDLDVSIIDELPPGRTPVKTKWIKDEIEKETMYQFIENKLNEGRQIYVVCPLIEESEKMELNAATKMYEEFNERYNKHKVALLHGKMKSDEKEKVMREFKKNQINVLVSTTVIEVGVNVPNASIMLVVDANRFGLAQLHQLRGRVGRGEHKSFCFLEAEIRNEISEKRLKIMEKINDGFQIAEEDLKIRKSGEIFGTKQSGFSDLKFVDIVKDIKLIKYVRDEVINYLEKNSGILKNKYLLKDLEEKFKNI